MFDRPLWALKAEDFNSFFSTVFDYGVKGFLAFLALVFLYHIVFALLTKNKTYY